MKIAPRIVHEDCSGVAFQGLDVGKLWVKASCWTGATDVLEGKCKTDSAEMPANDAQADGLNLGSQ